MTIEAGTGQLPIIYTVEHASYSLNGYEKRIALTPDLVKRCSDYGSDLTVPKNGIAYLLAKQSRALVDLNRAVGAEDLFRSTDFAHQPNQIWLPGQELANSEKKQLRNDFYYPYHQAIVDFLKQRSEPTLLVSWHNTANKQIGTDESGNPEMMPTIVLSNRGQKGTAEQGDELVTCDPIILEKLATHLARLLGNAGLKNDILFNTHFRGGYVTQRYSSRRNSDELKSLGIYADIQSLQVEYNTILTHDQQTLEENTEAIIKLREVFELAFSQTLQTVGFCK